MLNFVQLLSLLFTITMRLNISAVQHSLAVSLLTKGCSQHKIQTRTGLGKGTVGKINDEVERNNKNHSGGCSSKLSTQDSHTILCQITIEKLNNAVQATKCINSIIFDHFLSQTVRKTLKEIGLHSATKKEVSMLKASHWQQRLKFTKYHENWTVKGWKRVLWSDETKINQIGSDWKVYVWKKGGEPPSDQTTAPTVKHRGGNNLMVWGYMG